MNRNILKKILKYISKYKILLIVSLFLSLVSVFISLYIPVLAGKAIDTVVGQDNVDFAALKSELLKIIIIALLGAVIGWIINSVNNVVSFRVIKDIRNTAVEKIKYLPVSYLDKRTVGDIVSCIISDADAFADGLIMGFTNFFTGIMTIFGTFGFMISISVKITPVVVLLTPLSLFIASFVANKTHSMYVKRTEIKGNQTQFINSSVTGRNVITAYNYENNRLKEFDCINEEYASTSLKAIFFSSITNPSTRFINNVIYAFVALTGSLVAISGGITVGGITCFLSYAGQFAKPFNEISGVIAELQNSIACAERLFDIIDAEAECENNNSDLQLDSFKGDFRFDNVEFSYSPDSDLIEQFSLDVPSGSKVAIVGPTGCGKTTVVNLLMRFYDTDSGTISIDGINIKDIKRSDLRKNIGMVLQDSFIIEGTVTENIVFGRDGYSFEDVVNAAKSAHIHSFISKLPNGYDTVLNNEFSGLSKGQKQLICIARLMLDLPSVLILDEATSSIDTRTEITIRNAFDKMMIGRTSFVVAHRLSTIKNSDNIIVMKDGKITESGTHNELINKNGFYSELWRISGLQK